MAVFGSQSHSAGTELTPLHSYNTVVTSQVLIALKVVYRKCFLDDIINLFEGLLLDDDDSIAFTYYNKTDCLPEELKSIGGNVLYLSFSKGC